MARWLASASAFLALVSAGLLLTGSAGAGGAGASPCYTVTVSNISLFETLETDEVGQYRSFAGGSQPLVSSMAAMASMCRPNTSSNQREWATKG